MTRAPEELVAALEEIETMASSTKNAKQTLAEIRAIASDALWGLRPQPRGDDE